MKLEQANERIRKRGEEKDQIESKLLGSRSVVEKMNIPGERAEATYLNVIGTLLGLMLGKSPAGKPYSVFDSQAAIISALLGNYCSAPEIMELKVPR